MPMSYTGCGNSGEFMVFTVPDYLPPLRRGVGATPDNGGCLMQVVNYLARGIWTDSPARNVHPALQRAAIMVNDAICDDCRPRLWPLVPRLMKTFDYRAMNTLISGAMDYMVRDTINSQSRMICPTCSTNPIASYTGYNVCVCHWRCEKLIQILSGLLTEFDVMVHRPIGYVEQPVEWQRLRMEYIKQDGGRWVSRTIANACVPSHLVEKMTADIDAMINAGTAIKMELTTSTSEMLTAAKMEKSMAKMASTPSITWSSGGQGAWETAADFDFDDAMTAVCSG